MKKKVTRRDFIEKAAKLAGVVALSTFGDWCFLANKASAGLPGISVGDSKEIIELSKLKEHQAVNFMYKKLQGILIYYNDEVRAFENICTHRKGPTVLKGDKIVCRWHGATFDPLTGEALSKPAPEGSKLKAIPVEIKEGKIVII